MCSHLNRDLKLEPVSRHGVAILSATLLRFQITNHAELLQQNQSPKFMTVSAKQDPNGQKLRAFVKAANGLVASDHKSKIREPLYVNSPISGSTKAPARK